MKLRVFILILFFPFYFNAQYFEAGISLGTSNYQGDLTPTNLWTSVGDAHLAKSAFVRYNPHRFLALRLEFSHGVISASDAKAKELNYRKERNLSFRSNIFELALLGEINILGFQPEGRRKMFSPYLFGGVAIFRFNPQANFEGKWYDLQPLGTEGQGLPGYSQKYSLQQFSIPVGLGLKIALSEKYTIAIETGTRKTSTDYLDDVSSIYPDLDILSNQNGAIAANLSWRNQELNSEAIPPKEGDRRGDPEDRDWYIFSKITFSFNFIQNRNSNYRRKYNRRILECPKF